MPALVLVIIFEITYTNVYIEFTTIYYRQMDVNHHNTNAVGSNRLNRLWRKYVEDIIPLLG